MHPPGVNAVKLPQRFCDAILEPVVFGPEKLGQERKKCLFFLRLASICRDDPRGQRQAELSLFESDRRGVHLFRQRWLGERREEARATRGVKAELVRDVE